MRVVEERPHYQPGSGVSLLGLPLLLVGWATFAKWIGDVSARWYRFWPHAGEVVMLFWLGLATGRHLVRDAA